MIKLTKEEFSNFVPTGNMVLVEPVIDTSKVTFGELTIDINTEYQPENHVRVINRVVSLPKELKFSMNPHQYRSMEWDTTMELKHNDIVWINYLAGLKATKIECEGMIYILIPYSQIYLARREKEIKTLNKIRETVVMLNGYVLVEPTLYKVSNILDVPDKVNMRIMKVVVLGRPNKRYKDVTLMDDDYVRVGDRVVMKNLYHRKLEYDLHARFDKELYVTQRSRILGVLYKNIVFEEIPFRFSKSVKG